MPEKTMELSLAKGDPSGSYENQTLGALAENRITERLERSPLKRFVGNLLSGNAGILSHQLLFR
jgi:hypothetical protein